MNALLLTAWIVCQTPTQPLRMQQPPVQTEPVKIYPRLPDKPTKIGTAAKWLSYAGIPAEAADILSTETILSGGGHERNPLVRNQGVRIGYKTGMAALNPYVVHHQIAAGHPVRALISALVGIAVPTVAAIHNMKQPHYRR